MRHTIYDIKTCLVEIVNTKTDRHIKPIWNWEITIATHGLIHKGRAIERKMDVSIDWIELKSQNLLDEMINQCKLQM